MSAARHLHPDQLSMFMPAHHLADPSKVEYTGTADEGSHAALVQKRTYKSGKLRTSIRQEGVVEPIPMSPYGPTVMDGHHRIFTANSVNKHMEIPVVWDD